jgi:hypothetical protein
LREVRTDGETILLIGAARAGFSWETAVSVR